LNWRVAHVGGVVAALAAPKHASDVVRALLDEERVASDEVQP
jgi:hypothetical protein